jgi:hypothetical protein
VIDFTLNGEEVQISFRRTTTYSEAKEGCDADGNRGEWMWSMDDDEYDDVTVDFIDKACASLALKDLEEPLRPIVVKAIEDYMENHEPDGEMEEPDEPEDDPYERQIQREERERRDVGQPDPID